MKIGLKISQIKKGGKFEAAYYDNVLVKGVRAERKGNRMYIDMEDADVPFSWVKANITDLNLPKIAIFVEAPVSYLDTNVPAWLPKRKWTDAQSISKTHTFKTWGDDEGKPTEQYISRKSLDGTKIVIAITRAGDNIIDANIVSKIAAVANVTVLTVDETRKLVNGPAYTPVL